MTTAKEKASVEEAPRSTARVDEVRRSASWSGCRWSGQAAGIHPGRGPSGGPDLRGPRRRRQGRGDPGITEPHEPALRPGGRAPAPTDGSGGNGTSSATCPTCRPRARSPCSTARYNRAVVERVLGCCTDEEYLRFSCVPARSSSRCWSGTASLIKVWLAVSDTEQDRRFQPRRPTRRSAGSSARWTWRPATAGSTSRAPRTRCSPRTDIPEAPWWVVEAEVKKRARLNVYEPSARARCPTRTSPPSRRSCRPGPRSAGDYIPAPEGEPALRPGRRPEMIAHGVSKVRVPLAQGVRRRPGRTSVGG